MAGPDQLSERERVMEEIRGRNAVVTGAGKGLGRSIALALSAEGANVAVADIDKSAAQAVAEEITNTGARATAHAVDVSSLEQVEALADQVYREFGSVEILVNNAGISVYPFRASWDTAYEDFRRVMDVNFWGVLHGHVAFVPRMRETTGEKHIVNTSSMASLVSVAGISAYSASKGAVDGFSHAAREELKTQNIGVSLLNPGPVRTRVETGEQVPSPGEGSGSRGFTPWSDYVQTPANPIVEGREQRPEQDPAVARTWLEYIAPEAVGGIVVEGIKANRPHILTHPAPLDQLQERLDAILAGAPEPRQE